MRTPLPNTELSSRLTRKKPECHELALIAWPVGCRTLFGHEQQLLL
jgi:hypothetical protein